MSAFLTSILSFRFFTCSFYLRFSAWDLTFDINSLWFFLGEPVRVVHPPGDLTSFSLHLFLQLTHYYSVSVWILLTTPNVMFDKSPDSGNRVCTTKYFITLPNKAHRLPYPRMHAQTPSTQQSMLPCSDLLSISWHRLRHGPRAGFSTALEGRSTHYFMAFLVQSDRATLILLMHTVSALLAVGGHRWSAQLLQCFVQQTQT